MKQILLFPFLVLLLVPCIYSQEPGELNDSPSSGDQIENLTQRLDNTVANFRIVVREAQELGFKYVNAQSVDEAAGYVEAFYAKVKEGNQIRDQIVPLAEQLFGLKVAGTDRADDELAHLTTPRHATVIQEWRVWAGVPPGKQTYHKQSR